MQIRYVLVLFSISDVNEICTVGSLWCHIVISGVTESYQTAGGASAAPLIMHRSLYGSMQIIYRFNTYIPIKYSP